MKNIEKELQQLEEIMSVPGSDIFTKEEAPVVSQHRYKPAYYQEQAIPTSKGNSEALEVLGLVSDIAIGYTSWLVSGAINLTIQVGGAILVLGFNILWGLAKGLISLFTSTTDKLLSVDDYDWSQPASKPSTGGNVFTHSVDYKGDGFSVKCDTTVRRDT